MHFLVLRPEQANGAAEGVGVGNQQGAFSAENLEVRLLKGRVVHVEGGKQRGDGAGGEAHLSGQIGIHIHLNLFAVVGLRGDGALREGGLGKALKGVHLSQQMHQCRHVIGAHVHHGAAAPLVIKFRVRMPGFVAMADHGALRADHISDHAVVDELAAGLNARAHESIRCAAHVQAGFPGQFNELVAFFHVRRQGLFGKHVLPVQKRLLGHLVMLVGPGDVQHHVHLRVIEGFVHVLIDFRRRTLKSLLLLLFYKSNALFRPFGNQIAHADEADLPEGLRQVFQIDAADGAHADHCYLNHVFSPFSLNTTSPRPLRPHKSEECPR